MAVWKQDSRFLFVWRSGLQYSTEFRCVVSLEDVRRRTMEFYSRKRLVAEESNRLVFEGGKKFLSKASPFLPGLETWLFHRISIELPDSGEPVMRIEYDAECSFVVCFPRISFQKEARNLEAFVNTSGEIA